MDRDMIDADSPPREIEHFFEEFLSGTDPGRFPATLDLSGTTPFQREVYEALMEVGYGRTITYSGLAKAIHRPGSARAVGNAVGRNPLLIVIPCHRVLARNGIGGFSSGIGLKMALLMNEGHSPDVFGR
jgi:methylated-DNA-[protein]-cysteine S-methyltransferase